VCGGDYLPPHYREYLEAFLMQELPTSRKEALSKNSNYYFSGKPCPKGHISKRYTINSSCSICIKENSERWKNKGENKEKANLTRRVWRYKITKEEFNYLVKLQNNKCKICNNEFKGLKNTHVDHNHKSGKVRGLLCDTCNRGLGYFHDDIIKLEKAIEYLKQN
jgi:hypothetical protein